MMSWKSFLKAVQAKHVSIGRTRPPHLNPHPQLPRAVQWGLVNA